MSIFGPNSAAYAASKGGVVQYTKAVQLLGLNIIFKSTLYCQVGS